MPDYNLPDILLFSTAFGGVTHMDFSGTFYGQWTCLNGHVIRSNAPIDPEFDDTFFQQWCDKCGARVIARCPSCSGWLRGRRKAVITGHQTADSYCVHCGKALPWTETRFEAIREIADCIDSFSDIDKETLRQIMPDLIAKEGTPKTEVAIVKMKLLLKKGGSTFLESARKLLVDIVSETAQKALFPQ
jgi:hypothetical protein